MTYGFEPPDFMSLVFCLHFQLVISKSIAHRDGSSQNSLMRPQALLYLTHALKLDLLVTVPQRLALNVAVVVPFILVLCSTVIEREGLVEGIYRLSGFPSMVAQLRRTFDKEDEASLRQRFQITSQGVRDSVFVEEAPATPAPTPAGSEPSASASTSASANANASTGAPVTEPQLSETDKSGPPAPAPGKTHTPDVLKRKQSFVRKWYRDIYSLAAVLKMYFRELPNPLFTYQLYNRFQVRFFTFAMLFFYAPNDVPVQNYEHSTCATFGIDATHT